LLQSAAGSCFDPLQHVEESGIFRPVRTQRRVSAPYVEGEQPMTDHFIEILRYAHVELTPEDVVVSLDSWRDDRLWLGFQAVLH